MSYLVHVPLHQLPIFELYLCSIYIDLLVFADFCSTEVTLESWGMDDPTGRDDAKILINGSNADYPSKAIKKSQHRIGKWIFCDVNVTQKNQSNFDVIMTSLVHIL